MPVESFSVGDAEGQGTEPFVERPPAAKTGNAGIIVGGVVLVVVVSGVFMLIFGGGGSGYKCSDEASFGFPSQSLCNTCLDQAECMDCKEGNEMWHCYQGNVSIPECKTCLPVCSEVQRANQCTYCYNNLTCAACDAGYFVNSTSLCEFQCTEGQKNCAKCSTADVCTACDEGYVKFDISSLVGTTCKYVCNAQQRKEFCLECTDSASCTSCDNEHDLDDGKCEFAKCTTEQVAEGCSKCTYATHQLGTTTCRECRDGFSFFNGECLDDGIKETGLCKPSVPEFYTYRAMSSEMYPMNGINTASAGGVMRYVHEEVVGVDCCVGVGPARKYKIDRIRRFRVLFKNHDNPTTPTGQFTNFVQFDKAKCTLPGCDAEYKKNGYNVGCQVQHVQNFFYNDASWLSFPGTCPSQEFADKTTQCETDDPGGACLKPDGSSSCTYHLEQSGEVMLDELVGTLPNYKDWVKSGGVEFVLHPNEKGAAPDGRIPTIDFWKERKNVALNDLRTKKLLKTFRTKYPDSVVLPGNGR